MVRNEKNISEEEMNNTGEEMPRKKKESEIPTIVAGIFAIYGFLAFTDPIKYPIIGGFLQEYYQYDRVIGLIIMLFGLFFLFGRKR